MGVDYSRGADGTIFGADGDRIHLVNQLGSIYLTIHMDELADIKQFIEGRTEPIPRDWLSRKETSD